MVESLLPNPPFFCIPLHPQRPRLFLLCSLPIDRKAKRVGVYQIGSREEFWRLGFKRTRRRRRCVPFRFAAGPLEPVDAPGAFHPRERFNCCTKTSCFSNVSTPTNNNLNAVHKEYIGYFFGGFLLLIKYNCLLFLVIFCDTGDVLLLSCYTVDAFKRMLFRGERGVNPRRQKTFFCVKQGCKACYVFILCLFSFFFLN